MTIHPLDLAGLGLKSLEIVLQAQAQGVVHLTGMQDLFKVANDVEGFLLEPLAPSAPTETPVSET